MRRDFAVVPLDQTLGELCRQFQISAAIRVFAVDEKGGYRGYVDLAEAHGARFRDGGAASHVSDVVRGAEHFLTPGQPIRETLDHFIASAAQKPSPLSTIPAIVGYRDI